MKKVLLTLIVAAASFVTFGQELAPDQNPNYKQSMDKYAATQVSLLSNMNTTVQNTYKAYDWSTAKAERQAERRNFRRERVLFRNMNNGWNNNGWNNNGWNNGWNNNNNPFRNRFFNNGFRNWCW